MGKEVVTEGTVRYTIYVPKSVAGIVKDISKGKPEKWIVEMITKLVKGGSS